jgi:hypothetical protein
MSPRHDALLDEITSVEVIVTDSVMEALALENNLIKQRSPKYNILLRDDKNYPYLQLTTSEPFPRMLVARHVERDGDFYAGPFLPAKLGATHDGARPPAVRNPLMQRSHYRTAGQADASSTTSNAASRRALLRFAVRNNTGLPWPTPDCCSRGATTS